MVEETLKGVHLVTILASVPPSFTSSLRTHRETVWPEAGQWPQVGRGPTGPAQDQEEPTGRDHPHQHWVSMESPPPPLPLTVSLWLPAAASTNAPTVRQSTLGETWAATHLVRLSPELSRHSKVNTSVIMRPAIDPSLPTLLRGSCGGVAHE